MKASWGCCSHDCFQARTDVRIIGDACGGDPRSTQPRVSSVRGSSRVSMGKREGWSKLVSRPPFYHPPHHSCRSRKRPCSCPALLKNYWKRLQIESLRAAVLKVCLQTGGSSSTWELARNAESREPHPRPTESETLGVGPSTLFFGGFFGCVGSSLLCTGFL